MMGQAPLEGAMHATTILALRRNGQVVMVGDGQVTLGDVVMKHRARKIRRLHHDTVLAGFAGSAAVDLAKEWRTDRFLRRLEAYLLAASMEAILWLSGDGEVIEPDEDVVAIGSGGAYAQAAATALMRHTEMEAVEIARAAMRIAGEMCIYTNTDLVLEALPNQ